MCRGGGGGREKKIARKRGKKAGLGTQWEEAIHDSYLMADWLLIAKRSVTAKKQNVAPAGVAQWLNVDQRTKRSWLDSQSGLMPGLQAWSPVAGMQGQSIGKGFLSSMSLFLCPSSFLSL